MYIESEFWCRMYTSRETTYILLLDSALVSDGSSGLRNVLDVVSRDDELILGTFSDGDTLKHWALSDNLLTH